MLETEACGPLAHLDDVSQLRQLPHDLVRHPLAEVVLQGSLHHRGDTREGKGACQRSQGEVVEAEDRDEREQRAEKPPQEFVKKPINEKEEPKDQD